MADLTEQLAYLKRIAEALEGGSHGVIELQPNDFCLATGAPLAVFADGNSAVPGLALVDSEALAVRWNNHATPDAILGSFLVPPDLDDDEDIEWYFFASKVGATVGDAVTWLMALYFQTVGALHDADANAGGTSTAMVGNAATKTEQVCELTTAAADVPAYPGRGTLTVKPTNGTLGTDDVCLFQVIGLYTKKAAEVA